MEWVATSVALLLPRLPLPVSGPSLNTGLTTTPERALKQALLYANGQIYAAAQQNPQLYGMGTTSVVLLFRAGEVYYAHVGDSRIYRLSGGRLERLTRDHSYVQQLVDQGVITEQEAENHPRRNELTRALGTSRDIQVDVGAQPLKPRPDDLFLLCTDGLTGTLSDEDIRLELLGGSSVQQRAMRLVERANEPGGYDNTTVQIIQFKATPQPIIPPPVPPKPAIEHTVIEKPVLDQSIFEQPVNDPFITPKPVPAVPVSRTEQPVFEKPKAEPSPVTPPSPPTLSPQMPRKAAARKGPDISLIVLGTLALIVIVLFISGSKYMSDDPVENSELVTGRLDTTAVADESAVTEEAENPPSNGASTTKKPDKPEKTTSTASGGTTITHTVKAGETFNSIARRYNLKLETLKSLNGNVKEGDIKSDVTKLKVKVKAVHTVGPGDVLNVVSRKYNVPKDLIMAANGKTQDRADRGETLYIPFAEKQ